MKRNIYVIFDHKGQYYNVPFYLHNDAMAVRVLTDLVNEEGSEINKHPEDFSVFHIGEYENNHAELVPCEPRQVARAHELPINVKLNPEYTDEEK